MIAVTGCRGFLRCPGVPGREIRTVATATPDTDAIRNVVLLGHTGTGKTTLARAMAEAAGDKPPQLDFEPEETDRGRSLALSTATMTYDGCRINVIDTPGSIEALGDVYPALGVADCAAFVVDAAVGLEPQHARLWEAAAAADLPRIVFLNKLDQEHATYQDNIDALRDAYGRPLAPVQMPIGVGDEFTGVIDLLGFTAVEQIDGRRVEEEVPDERRDQAERNRVFLVEAVVEQDDDLLMAYLEGEEPDVAAVAELFAEGIAEHGFFPVLCGSAAAGIGIELFLQFLVGEAPSPSAGPQPADPDGDTAAVVYKTRSDQYVGRINLLRVLAGTLHADDHLTVQRTGADLRLHQLFRLSGEDQQPVEVLPAGDLAAVAKLDDVVTGDVLAAGDPPPVALPEAPVGYHRVVLHPATASDDDKLSTTLHRMLEEDPSIRRADAEANASVLAFHGPQHVAVTVERLARQFGVDVTAEPAPVEFRETIRSTATGIGKHVKQSGGHGQYGVAQIEVSPLPRGSGFEFEDAIVGGAIPSGFIPSVEKGVREATREGPLGGFPVVDLHVRLFDGKHHSVDSSDAAFQMAGILAFRDAMEATRPVLLEPVMEVDISVPEDLVGTVMSDLSGRRGQILGTDAAGAGRTMVHAHVPEVELRNFAAEFRALTSARGSMAMRHHHHQEVAADVADRLIERHAPDA